MTEAKKTWRVVRGRAIYSKAHGSGRTLFKSGDELTDAQYETVPLGQRSKLAKLHVVNGEPEPSPAPEPADDSFDSEPLDLGD